MAHGVRFTARLAPIAAFGAGCAGAGLDVDGTTPTAATGAPDLAGVYEAVFGDRVGCEDQPTFPIGWPEGRVTVRGLPDDLVFDFGDGAIGGTVDDAFSFTLDGQVTAEGWSLTLRGLGLAYIGAGADGPDADRWVLDGDVDLVGQMDVDEGGAGGTTGAAECTASGRWTATEDATRSARVTR